MPRVLRVILIEEGSDSSFDYIDTEHLLRATVVRTPTWMVRCVGMVAVSIIVLSRCACQQQVPGVSTALLKMIFIRSRAIEDQ